MPSVRLASSNVNAHWANFAHEVIGVPMDSPPNDWMKGRDGTFGPMTCPISPSGWLLTLVPIRFSERLSRLPISLPSPSGNPNRLPLPSEQSGCNSGMEAAITLRAGIEAGGRESLAASRP